MSALLSAGVPPARARWTVALHRVQLRLVAVPAHQHRAAIPVLPPADEHSAGEVGERVPKRTDRGRMRRGGPSGPPAMRARRATGSARRGRERPGGLARPMTLVSGCGWPAARVARVSLGRRGAYVQRPSFLVMASSQHSDARALQRNGNALCWLNALLSKPLAFGAGLALPAAASALAGAATAAVSVRAIRAEACGSCSWTAVSASTVTGSSGLRRDGAGLRAPATRRAGSTGVLSVSNLLRPIVYEPIVGRRSKYALLWISRLCVTAASRDEHARLRVSGGGRALDAALCLPRFRGLRLRAAGVSRF
jgi:hypothetical protein